MNFKRARFWRNLLLFSALSSAASLHSTKAEDGVSRIGDGAATQAANPNPGMAVVPSAEGYVPLSSSPYMPLDPGYNFNRPMPPALPPAYETLRNSRRDAIGPRFDVGQFLNDRLGVDGGDTNFNFLLPILVGSEHEVLFVDGRGLVSQSGRGGASAGVGYRVYAPDMDRVLGISGWVDYDDTNNRTYQQAGLSFESLGRWIDVRVNGYIPFGRDNSVISRSFVGDPFFGGSNLLVNQRTATESAFSGLDAEIGGPLPVLGRYGVSGYVGGYWLDSPVDDTAVGPRVRLEANVTDNFRVNVSASNDSVFGSNAWVNFQMTLPDGRARRWFRPIPVEDKLLSTVHRDYRVHAHTRIDVAPTPVLMASGANAGQPVSVIFVDPDRMINGTGTLESPLIRFTGFVNSPSNTLIVVDGSANSNPVRGNVTLYSDQKLLSTSILAAGGVQLNTNLGLITLPSLSGFGDATPVSPILMSQTGGTLVTLASNNGNNIEVAGFTFDGTTGNGAIPHASGIVGTNIVNFNIHHNRFENYTNGVVLNNATGTGFFQANTLTGTPGVSNDGFRVTNSGVGTLNLFADTYSPPTDPTGTAPANTLPVEANSITGNDGAGIRVTARNRAEINAHIVGNTVSDNGDGIVLDADATRGVIRGSVVNNVIDGNRGEDRNRNGILETGEDRDGDLVLDQGNGLVLTANAGTLEMAALGEDANANGTLDPTEDLNGNGVLNLAEDTNGNGVLDLGEDLNGNGVLDASEDANGNGALDLAEDANGNGILDGGYIISGNTITNNTGNGISVTSTNNSNVNMILTRNLIGDPADRTSGNGGRGLSIVADSGQVNANIGFVVNEDININGQLDTEDLDGDGVLDFGEDVNSNGVLDTEDTNGNGTLDAAAFADGNFFIGNQGGGILADLSGTALGNLVALNNVVGTGDGNLTFVIDGTTNESFSFTNSSQRGINLTGFGWELTPTAAGLFFDTTTTPFSVALTDIDATTLQTVNADAGTPSVNGNSLTYAVTSGDTLVDLRFVGMNSTDGVLGTGEDTNLNNRLELLEDQPLSLPFQVGVGPIVQIGSDFIGSTVVATFASGHTLTGTMRAVPGDTQAAMFVPSTNASSIVTGPGIEMRASGSAIFNNPTIVQNDVRFQGGAGILIHATEDGQFRNLLIHDNIVQNNGATANGGGISLNTTTAATASIMGSILNNRVNDNFGPGIFVTADSGLIDVREIDNNVLNGNTNGLSLNTLNNGTITTRVTRNTMNSSTETGFLVLADTGTITLNQFTENAIAFSGGNGIRWEANNSGLFSITPSEDANGNGLLDDGEDLNSNELLDLGTFHRGIPEDTNGNGILDGTEDTNGNGVLDLGEDRNGNGQLDVTEDLNANGILDTEFVSNTLTNNADNGLFITGTGGNFNLDVVSGLSISRLVNGTGGITIDVTDSVLSGSFINNLLVGGAAIDPNTGLATNANTGAGFSLTATGTPGNLSNLFSVAVNSNQIDNNAGAGVSIVMRQDAVGTFAIRNNTITRTVNDLSEDLNGNNRLDLAEDTNGNGLLDPGEDANLNGVLDPSEDRNANGVLDTNSILSGEGIFVQMVGTPVLPNARGVLSDSVIEGNIIGGSTAAVGNASHGIAFDIQEETTVRNLTISGENLIVNNGGDGINFRRRDNAEVENVLILRNLISNNGEDLDGDGVLGATEDLNGNGLLDGDGIRISASEGGGTILGFALQENEITRNRMSGIHLHVAADARLDVDIARNLIDANGTTGTAALVNFESGRGILTTENFGHSTDMREIGGEWIANQITNNAGQGIRLDATSTNIFNEIEKNLTANNLVIGGNLIDSNGLDGILVNGPGRLTIDSNTITNNGIMVALALGTGADPATTGSDLGNGIAIRSVMLDEFGNVADQTLAPELMNAPGSTLELRAAGPKFVEIVRNEIRENADDGLEIRHANQPSRLHDAELHPGFFPLTVVARENTIETNGRRGIDILNQGGLRTPENIDDGPPETGADTGVNPPVATITNTTNQFSPTDSTIRLLDNKIASNGKEGIYVVNTASLTQGQAGETPVPADPEDSSRGMLATGSEIDAVPRLALEVHHNLIIKNGQRLDVDAAGNAIDTITGSGLVIRVGTSDAEIIPSEPGLVTAAGFGDFASAPGDPTAPLFGETGFRNADEILAATGANFGQLGFFNRLQPGGVVAKITNNGLNDLGQRDLSSGFEGNFGADVYIESFVSGGVGAEFPSIARLDMIFENNAGDAIDVTNFGASFFQPRANGQRLASQVNIPGLTLPLFGRVVGVHLGNVEDLPSTPDDNASPSSFFAFDAFDPLSTPLDDRAAVYDGLEIVMIAAPDTDAADSIVATYTGLPLGNRFGLQTALPATPANGDPFRVELSQTTVFDVVLFGAGQDPRVDLNAAPIRGIANPATGTFLNQGAILRFIDEQGVDDLQQPIRDQQVVINNNFEVDFGVAVDLTNPNIFHVDPSGPVDIISPTPRTGEGPVASNSSLPGMPGTLPGKTSNQTLEVLPGLTRAPRDGNLFVITAISAGQGPSAFRVAGATVASQAEVGINVDTNAFTHNNLGFDDAVSLESGDPQGDELPFEWGVLPDANRTRILQFFPTLNPLPAAPQTFKDFTFQRIVFP